MYNPFNNPRALRQIILNSNVLSFKKKKLIGKSLACIFLTRFCSTGCDFCFYKSAPAWRKRNIEDQFSDEGVIKFIEFSRSANLGYLLVSGGGEPLNQRKHILQLVSEVQVDRIVLVTSANWAKNYIAAKSYIDDIYNATLARSTPTTVVLRVSVSTGHTKKIGIEPAVNVIKIFKDHYAEQKNFILQIKTFDEDPTLIKVLSEFQTFSIDKEEVLISDNNTLIKKIPTKSVITIEGYEFVVGSSKIFNSGLQPNLADNSGLAQGIDVFNADIALSEDDNPAVVFNYGEDDGIDWSINYNGDICTWQNQVRDNYMNLYEDDYDVIMQSNLNDPITYSFIDKGSLYRDRIVEEVDPIALLRTKAIGLRDTAGAIIFEEERTRLYYAIRVLQDYIAEGKITREHVLDWHPELIVMIDKSKADLIDMFNKSTYTIISQQKQKPFSEIEWRDLFQLIKLGHYNLSEQEISDALIAFNAKVMNPIKSLQDLQFEHGEIERRLTERLMHIKPLKRFAQESAVA